MSKITFIYEAVDDQYEHGKKVEYSFGKTELTNGIDGMTWDTVCDHFDYFLKSIGYVYEGSVTVIKDEDL